MSSFTVDQIKNLLPKKFVVVLVQRLNQLVWSKNDPWWCPDLFWSTPKLGGASKRPQNWKLKNIRNHQKVSHFLTIQVDLTFVQVLPQIFWATDFWSGLQCSTNVETNSGNIRLTWFSCDIFKMLTLERPCACHMARKLGSMPSNVKVRPWITSNIEHI